MIVLNAELFSSGAADSCILVFCVREGLVDQVEIEMVSAVDWFCLYVFLLQVFSYIDISGVSSPAS